MPNGSVRPAPAPSPQADADLPKKPAHYHCNVCDADVPPGDLRRHILEEHKEQNQPGYPLLETKSRPKSASEFHCYICNKTCHSAKGLDNHLHGKGHHIALLIARRASAVFINYFITCLDSGHRPIFEPEPGPGSTDEPFGDLHKVIADARASFCEQQSEMQWELFLKLVAQGALVDDDDPYNVEAVHSIHDAMYEEGDYDYGYDYG
jgi:hypothetical protein